MSKQLLYRITTNSLWKASGDTLELSEMDSEFIHFVEEVDIDRIIKKILPRRVQHSGVNDRS
ncbi:hypothetical protein SCG7086_AY_00090 [Chlamydiales bacterium SCGC AG-110-P3]|nr:hypothetical protein SCG7086_AY_00090 [Chlamydiales bacterium SCGC AG-110-P3]